MKTEETDEEFDREEVNAQIREGMAQLERGEGITDEELDKHLRKMKAERPAGCRRYER